MAAVSATTRAYLAGRAAWSRQASRLPVRPGPTPAPARGQPGRGTSSANHAGAGDGQVRGSGGPGGPRRRRRVLVVIQQTSAPGHVTRRIGERPAPGRSGGSGLHPYRRSAIVSSPSPCRASRMLGRLRSQPAGQGGSGVGIDGGAWVQAQEAEELLLVRSAATGRRCRRHWRCCFFPRLGSAGSPLSRGSGRPGSSRGAGRIPGPAARSPGASTRPAGPVPPRVRLAPPLHGGPGGGTSPALIR